MDPRVSNAGPGSVPIGQTSPGYSGLLDRMYASQGMGLPESKTPLADAYIRDILAKRLGLDPLQASRIRGFDFPGGGGGIGGIGPNHVPPGANAAMQNAVPVPGAGGQNVPRGTPPTPPPPQSGDARYLNDDAFAPAPAAGGSPYAPTGLLDRLARERSSNQPIRGVAPQGGQLPTTKNGRY